MELIICKNGIFAVIEDCMCFVYNCSSPDDCEYVAKVNSEISVNGASMIYILTH